MEEEEGATAGIAEVAPRGCWEDDCETDGAVEAEEGRTVAGTAGVLVCGDKDALDAIDGCER